MKLAQSSFVYFNYPIQHAIRRLRQFGYQGIEIWGGRPHVYRHDLDDALDSIRRLLDELEMSVPNFIPAQFRYPSILCSANEHVRRDSVAYLQDAIDNALKLGAPSVSVCPGMTVHGESIDQGWACLRQSLIELLEYTERTHVKLLIEPAHAWETTLIRTVDEALQMIAEIKAERLGVCFDTGHANINGEDLAQAVHRLKNVPLHIHIDDNHGESDAHNIPGTGKIDFQALARALNEINYPGFVSAELGFQYTLDPDAAVQATYTALERIF